MDLSQLDPTKPGGGESVDQGALRIRETRDASITSVGVQHSLTGPHTFKSQDETGVLNGSIAVDAGSLSFSDGAGWYVAGGLLSQNIGNALGGGQITYGTRSIVGLMSIPKYAQYIPYWQITGQSWWRWGCPMLANWRWYTTTSGAPGVGQIHVDSTNTALVTKMWVHHNNLLGNGTGQIWLSSARAGYDFYILDNNGTYSRFRINGSPTDFSSYFTVPVSFVGGTMPTTVDYISVMLLPNNLWPWSLMTFTFRFTIEAGYPAQADLGNPVTINTSGFSMDEAGNNLDQTWIIVPGLIVPTSPYPTRIGIDGQGNMQEGMMNLDFAFCVVAAE